jgi:hypothetical protein
MRPCFICGCKTTITDWHFVSSIFVEDDPDDVDFEPDSETDKAADKVTY